MVLLCISPSSSENIGGLPAAVRERSPRSPTESSEEHGLDLRERRKSSLMTITLINASHSYSVVAL